MNEWCSNSVVCRYIDEGKNPQLYTKDCMEKALAKNEAVKGKIDVLKVCMQHRIEINNHINKFAILGDHLSEKPVCYFNSDLNKIKAEVFLKTETFCLNTKTKTFYAA